MFGPLVSMTVWLWEKLAYAAQQLSNCCGCVLRRGDKISTVWCYATSFLWLSDMILFIFILLTLLGHRSNPIVNTQLSSIHCMNWGIICYISNVCQICLSQYFEYTSQKEIRFNSVTELCAEVQDGATHIGMKHCPQDGVPRAPSTIWEFRDVSLLRSSYSSYCTVYQIHFHAKDDYVSGYCFLSGWEHISPSFKHVYHILPHIRRPWRYPDEKLLPWRQTPALEIWVTLDVGAVMSLQTYDRDTW